MAKGDQTVPIPEMGGTASDTLRAVRREMKAIRRDLERQAKDGKDFDRAQVKRLQELSQLERRADRVKQKYDRARAEAARAEVVGQQIERNTRAALRAQEQAQRAGQQAMMRDSQAARAVRMLGTAGAIRNLARGQLGASDIAWFAASPDFFENAAKVASRLGFAKQGARLAKAAQGVGVAAPFMMVAIESLSAGISERQRLTKLETDTRAAVASGQMSANEFYLVDRELKRWTDPFGIGATRSQTAAQLASDVRAVSAREYTRDEADRLFYQNGDLVLKAQQQAQKRIQSEEARHGRSLTDAEREDANRASLAMMLAQLEPEEALQLARTLAEATKNQEADDHRRQLERMRPTAVYERHERDAMARIEWQRRRDRVPMLLTD